MRADCRMHALGLTPSREKARALIMAGKVTADGVLVKKPGVEVSDSCVFKIMEALAYVSRGGLKLKKAVDEFKLDLQDVIAADIGASTGGFTDCMLQEGAKKVYAIDVGYGQFDWKLRNDPRVAVMERTNARYMEPGWFAEVLDFASIDVSFISVKLILPALYACLKNGGQAAVLIKPQFEAGRKEVNKGVIRDPAVHRAVCLNVIEAAARLRFDTIGITHSPIKGPKGNMEFLALMCKRAGEDKIILPTPNTLDAVIQCAHESL